MSYAGTDIADVASHFQEVDLQDTLVVEWREVRLGWFAFEVHTTGPGDSHVRDAQIASIASQLPELVSLQLNGNGLRPLDEEQIAAFPP